MPHANLTNSKCWIIYGDSDKQVCQTCESTQTRKKGLQTWLVRIYGKWKMTRQKTYGK
jgi:7-cyano-7-deazaguanine synthase in queuosine biosynthesis